MKQEKFENLMKQVATGVLLGVFGVSGSALAATPNCGDVIGPGVASITFDSDLECPKRFDPAVTFVGPINVRMEGYTVKCKGNPRADVGILLLGTRVLLHDGVVLRCGNNDDSQGAGIVAAGDGKHRIDRMDVSKSNDEGVLLESDFNIVKSTESYNNDDDGFDVMDSDQNDLANNYAHDNGDKGFKVEGNRNKLTNNDANYNDDDGIEIEGDQNKVVSNTATYNGDDGIEVDEGDGNSVSLNTASNNDGAGIDVRVGATNTTMKTNQAFGNADADLEDDNPDCGSNVWKPNNFGTAEVDGGPNPLLPECIE